MKSALIDTPSTLVVQVNPLGETFEVDSAHEWVDCPDEVTPYNFTYVNGQFTPVPVPEPEPPTAEQNKQWAILSLYDTDWTTIPDVADPTKSNPYLGNVAEFIAFRNAVRKYAINPISGYPTAPEKPTAQWISV